MKTNYSFHSILRQVVWHTGFKLVKINERIIAAYVFFLYIPMIKSKKTFKYFSERREKLERFLFRINF